MSLTIKVCAPKCWRGKSAGKERRSEKQGDCCAGPQWIVPDRLVLDLARSPPRSSRNMRKAASHEHRLGSLSRKGLLLLKRDADKVRTLMAPSRRCQGLDRLVDASSRHYHSPLCLMRVSLTAWLLCCGSLCMTWFATHPQWP